MQGIQFQQQSQLCRNTHTPCTHEIHDQICIAVCFPTADLQTKKAHRNSAPRFVAGSTCDGSRESFQSDPADTCKGKAQAQCLNDTYVMVLKIRTKAANSTRGHSSTMDVGVPQALIRSREQIRTTQLQKCPKFHKGTNTQARSVLQCVKPLSTVCPCVRTSTRKALLRR